MSGLIVKAIPISTSHIRDPSSYYRLSLRNPGPWQIGRSQEARELQTEEMTMWYHERTGTKLPPPEGRDISGASVINLIHLKPWVTGTLVVQWFLTRKQRNISFICHSVVPSGCPTRPQRCLDTSKARVKAIANSLNCEMEKQAICPA